MCGLVSALVGLVAKKGCVGAIGEATVVCQLAGLGHEDHLSDICTVVIDTAIGVTSAGSGQLTSTVIKNVSGC